MIRKITAQAAIFKSTKNFNSECDFPDRDHADKLVLKSIEVGKDDSYRLITSEVRYTCEDGYWWTGQQAVLSCRHQESALVSSFKAGRLSSEVGYCAPR